MKDISILSYTNDYKDDVINVVLPIQKEFGITITLKDQPDLENIPNFYQKNKGNFWIAKINDTVVGTVALLDIGNDYGALRKMFVKAAYRGGEFGVGQLLLNTVLQWGKDNHLKKILLGTTEKFIAAHRFYEKNRFFEIDKELLPSEFPIMKVDVKFYEYILPVDNT
jgi:N-acetylglutamate synthase-like GNAT family acetyltransferase